MAGDIDQHSVRTLSSRRDRLSHLEWWAEAKRIDELDTLSVRAFFHYLGHGHMEPGGRWGNPRMTKPVNSGTVKSYHSTLRTFFGWLVAEGEIDISPMDRIPAPVDRPDQIQPFTDDQVRALLTTARRPQKNAGERRGDPRRDEAVLLLLLDTGIRASELCSLTIGDLDLASGLLRVKMGKGGKARNVPFSRETKRAIYHYTHDRDCMPDDPLFLSLRGPTAREHLTPNGLHNLVSRWGRIAGVSGVRCSPHTFRHTFAISFLRAGGNVFTLKEILGHTSLAQTNRYVALAQADISRQHAQFSPVARLRARR